MGLVSEATINGHAYIYEPNVELSSGDAIKVINVNFQEYNYYLLDDADFENYQNGQELSEDALRGNRDQAIDTGLELPPIITAPHEAGKVSYTLVLEPNDENYSLLGGAEIETIYEKA